MSGHSKWSTIKHKKAAMDNKRGALFSKIGKDISIAVKEGGGGDAGTNPRLRMVLLRAKEANMPSENIKRAISRALSREEGRGFEEVIYEGYGPGGSAFIVKALTDNRQRTTAVLKSVFDRAGGNLSVSGSAMFMFELREGSYYPKMKMEMVQGIMEKVKNLKHDLENQEDVIQVFTSVELNE